MFTFGKHPGKPRALASVGGAHGGEAVDPVDAGRLHLWWGDERFLPAGDADRNETQAREALLDGWSPPPSQVHPMPALDGLDGDDVDAAAARYAEELAAGSVTGVDGLPVLDVVLLGSGPDGHGASLFPDKARFTAP